MKTMPQRIPSEYYPSEEIVKIYQLTTEEAKIFSILTYVIFQKTNIDVMFSQRFNKIIEEVLGIILNIREYNKGNLKNLHPKFYEMYELFLSAGNNEMTELEFQNTVRLAELYFKLIKDDEYIEKNQKELIKINVDSLDKLISNKADTFRAVSEDIIHDIIELREDEEPIYYDDSAKKVGLLIDILSDLKEKLTTYSRIAELKETIGSNEESRNKLLTEITQLTGKIKAA